MNVISDLVSGIGSGLLSGVSGLISNFVADPTKKLEAIQAFESLKLQYDQEAKKLIADLEVARLKDVDSARNMQIEAFKQEDKFSKRFVLYLTLVVIGAVIIFDFCMFFIHYPIENRDMINQVSGMLNSGAFITVLGFFFGSSQSSKTKEDTINKMATKT